jgi:hypothetical protein
MVSVYHHPMRTRASRDTFPRYAAQPHIMQPKQSTSAAAADPHATSIEQRTSEQIRTAVLASEQRITEQFLAANSALLAQLQHPTADSRYYQSIAIHSRRRDPNDGGW